jgi:hypothetical protein
MPARNCFFNILPLINGKNRTVMGGFMIYAKTVQKVKEFVAGYFIAVHKAFKQSLCNFSTKDSVILPKPP